MGGIKAGIISLGNENEGSRKCSYEFLTLKIANTALLKLVQIHLSSR